MLSLPKHLSIFDRRCQRFALYGENQENLFPGFSGSEPGLVILWKKYSVDDQPCDQELQPLNLPLPTKYVSPSLPVVSRKYRSCGSG
jgi:hypothetical protein